jgi:hypothetical protein
LCDHPECVAAGEYRAPRSPRRLTEFYWFCLDHVRAYNQAWNYYKGMTPDEVERETRSDVGWGRPTWPMGRQGPTERPRPGRVHDPFDMFAEDARAEARARARVREEAESQERDSEEGRAYQALDLCPPVSLTEVKARYKELAKRLHPDLNGGDAAAEERLKRINQAYAVLRKALSPSA